jgi:hypothetical protein
MGVSWWMITSLLREAAVGATVQAVVAGGVMVHPPVEVELT